MLNKNTFIKNGPVCWFSAFASEKYASKILITQMFRFEIFGRNAYKAITERDV